MKARGTLQRLIGLRGHEEKVRRQALGRALRDEEVVRNRESSARDELAAARRNLATMTSAACTGGELRRRHDRVLGMERVVEARVRDSAAAARRRVQAEQEYLIARRDRRALERVDETRAREQAAERRRLERREMDEVAIFRFVSAERAPFERTEEE